MTGHIRTPIPNRNDGQRYTRQLRRRQTSSPTIASASRNSPSSRKPVANIQWTCSLGGCIVRFQVVQQRARDEDVEDHADDDDEDRRLDGEPPERVVER